MTPIPPRWPALLLGVAFLGGCASFSPDGGLDTVAELSRERIGLAPEPLRGEADVARVAEEVGRLLAQPLSAESAVRIAILNNRALQASLANLGIAEADLVQAGRLRNPGFSFSRLAGGGEVEYERKFLFDLMGLLTLSTRAGIERRRFEATQLAVAGDTLQLAQRARQAWFAAVAARQAARHRESIDRAGEAASDLARKMADAGNFSRLRQQREQLLRAELRADLDRARREEVGARENLVRVLGLSGAQRGFALPDSLPELPSELMPEAAALAKAMDGRLDLRMARRELDGLGQSLGLTRSSRFINVLDVGYLNKSATGAPRATGYEIELALPLFDAGGARVAKAEALYRQAMHRVAAAAIDAESEVRDSHAAYRAAHDLARRYRDEIVPLQRSITEETLLRYNGMLLGVWDLLAEARRQLAGANASIQAQKDFWIAESNLQMSLNGPGGGGATLSAGPVQAAEAGGGGH